MSLGQVAFITNNKYPCADVGAGWWQKRKEKTTILVLEGLYFHLFTYIILIKLFFQ